MSSERATLADVALFVEQHLEPEGLGREEAEVVLASLRALTAPSTPMSSEREREALAKISRIVAGVEPGAFEPDPYKRLKLVQEIAFPYGMESGTPPGFAHMEAALTVSSETQGAQEPTYPCDRCGKLRTKAQGGTTFTACDACWDLAYPKRAPVAEPRCDCGVVLTACASCAVADYQDAEMTRAPVAEGAQPVEREQWTAEYENRKRALIDAAYQMDRGGKARTCVLAETALDEHIAALFAAPPHAEGVREAMREASARLRWIGNVMEGFDLPSSFTQDEKLARINRYASEAAQILWRALATPSEGAPDE